MTTTTTLNMPELEGVPRLVTAFGVQSWAEEGVAYSVRYVEARKGDGGVPIFNAIFDVETDEGQHEYLLVDPSNALDVRLIEFVGAAGVEAHRRALANL